MPISGPSREELQNYWKNSRAYFDELANHYRQSDPEYYKEYIEPFYTNPFLGGSGNKGCRTTSISLITLLIVIAGAVVPFILEMIEDKEDEDAIENIRNAESLNTGSRFNDLRKQVDSVLTLPYEPKDSIRINFEMTLEEKLKSIKNSDANYEESQQLLNKLRERKKSRSRRSLLN